ncbi:MAG: DUF1549 and DUF1553 domain-containing protein [Phycisphaerales bacterium]
MRRLICLAVAVLAMACGARAQPDLFSTNAEELMASRRRARAALLPPPPPVPDEPVAGTNPIDRFIVARARRNGELPERPLEPCDDAAFVRRVYLDVIGAIPTASEAARFLDDSRADKRERLIDEVLARDSDYADHWTPFWEDALVSSPVGDNGGMPTHGNYAEFIRRAFAENRPYDLFVAELIDPTMPRHKPAVMNTILGVPRRVHYILNESHTDTLQTAAGVAQVFLGTAMKCASCHNHFENREWPQDRFLAFAGLFAGHDLEAIRCEQKSGRMVAAAFPFEVSGAPREAPASERDRLARVAQLITDPLNPRFARSAVNRLWKRYVGLGFFEPADDYREEWPPSHPELLDWLARDLATSGYDLKRTIRLILTSRTYQARYDAELEDHFDVASPADPRWFLSPSLRRLTAEQTLDSIRVAMTQRLDPSQRSYRRSESTALSRALGKSATRNDVSTARSDEPAILQGLELLNGGEYAGLVGGGNLLREALGAETPEAAADVVYRAVLSRPSTEAERALVRDALGEEWAAREAGPVRETLWVDGAPPEGRRVGPWEFVQSGLGGRRANVVRAAKDGQAQNYVLGLPGVVVGRDNVLVARVRLDPSNPASEVMVQWNNGTGRDGGWGHRAYWGENRIEYGEEGSASRKRIGDLPRVGEWGRLEVPVASVGLEAGQAIVGVSLDVAGGTAEFDSVGIVTRAEPGANMPLRDLLWALFTSAEFQYAR